MRNLAMRGDRRRPAGQTSDPIGIPVERRFGISHNGNPDVMDGPARRFSNYHAPQLTARQTEWFAKQGIPTNVRICAIP